MASIKFILQSTNNPAGIYIRLKDGRTIDVKAKTKFSINPMDWSSTKGQVKSRYTEHKVINESLTNLSTELLKHYNSQQDKTIINTQWLKDFINPQPVINSTPNLLVDYFDYYLSIKADSLQPASIKKFNVVKNLLVRFEKHSKHNYNIAEVNEDFRMKFEKYSNAELYAPNTTARNLKLIKTICTHAGRNGIETHTQLADIKKKIEDVHRVYLTTDEITQIEKHNFKNDYLDNARDWLLISCETGQRVSDFIKFTKEQISYLDNIPIISFKQQKTNKKMEIPLTPKVMKILEKRNGDFPRKTSDQNYNDYIKEVCKLAGIKQKVKGGKMDADTKRKKIGMYEKWELISTHIGRRSYATNNYDKIPTTLLMYATGHTTEKSFLEYVGREPKEKAIDLAKYYGYGQK